MTAPSTSPARTPATNPETQRTGDYGEPAIDDLGRRASAPATTTGEWRRYAWFLRQPTLPAQPGQSTGKVQATVRMLALDLPLMGVLIASLTLAAAFGFEMPENVNSTLEPTMGVLALIVIVAPVLEELAFRSWLNGLPSLMAFIGLTIVGLAGVPLALSLLDPQGTMPLLAGIAVIFVALGLTAAAMLRKAETPDWYRRRFAFFYWGSTIGFALIHLGNYTQASWSMLVILLPLILPQFALGTMLGYLRVHYGLGPAIALHAAHNAILFGLAIFGGLGEMPGGAGA